MHVVACHALRAEFEAFAFQDTDDYSLEEFQQVAATFEEQWFGAEAAAKVRLGPSSMHPRFFLCALVGCRECYLQDNHLEQDQQPPGSWQAHNGAPSCPGCWL